MAVVALTADVLAQQSLDDGRPELPARSYGLAREDVSCEVAKRAAKPLAERDAEACLAARSELGRDEIGERAPKSRFPAPSVQSKLVRK